MADTRKHLTCELCNATFYTVESVVLHMQEYCQLNDSKIVFKPDGGAESFLSKPPKSATNSGKSSINSSAPANSASTENCWQNKPIIVEGPSEGNFRFNAAQENSSQGECPYCYPTELLEGNHSNICFAHRQWCIQESDFQIGQGKNNLQVGTGLPQCQCLYFVSDKRLNSFDAETPTVTSRHADQSRQNVSTSRSPSYDRSLDGKEEIMGPAHSGMTNMINRPIIEYQKDQRAVASQLFVPSQTSQLNFPTLSRRVTTDEDHITTQDEEKDDCAVFTFKVPGKSDLKTEE